MILLKTPHGSRLYNLNHSESDEDWYVVYAGKGRAKQTIVDGIDTMTISFDSFMHQCRKGVPQALEALYSQKKTVDKMPFIANSFNPVCLEVYKTYMRTIRNFWATGDFKRKRHAARLAINLSAILKEGRFNPSLSEFDIEYVGSVAVKDDAECPAIKHMRLNYTW